jgi:hypothetical protein
MGTDLDLAIAAGGWPNSCEETWADFAVVDSTATSSRLRANHFIVLMTHQWLFEAPAAQPP